MPQTHGGVTDPTGQLGEEDKENELAVRESEARYKAALSLGRMGSWETNFAAGTRIWSPEAQALFGFRVPGGIGSIGEHDEFVSAMHPDDRHLAKEFRKLADSVDSFDAEYRVVKDGTVIWLSGRGQVIERSRDGKCTRLISVVADITKQKEASDHIRLLLREMSHRSKNLITVIQSITRQMARRSESIEDFQQKLGDRLQGLAASHDILVEQNWQRAELAELLRRHLAPFVPIDSHRVNLSGAPLELTARAAQSIGLALHELATNAVKYGALSVPAGKVSVSWAVDASATADSVIILRWVESGGPQVNLPSSTGFGNEIVSRIVPRSVDGIANLEFSSTGLCYTLTMPIGALTAVTDDDTANAF